MPAIGDVVELANGDVGVIGESLPRDQWRVYFPNGQLDVLPAAIASTKSAPSYLVGDTVSVWPDQGDITAINGDEFTVSLDKQQFLPGLGYVTWTATVTVPRWRIIRDNDNRLERAL